MDKCDFTKTITAKSVTQSTETKVCFLSDIELKIIINCRAINRSNIGDSNAQSNSPTTPPLSHTDSQITITFFTLDNDIDCLIYGYLGTFLGVDFCFRRENNAIFIDLPLNKDEILFHLSQKDIIQSCEQITLSDKKNLRDNIIMPFNGSRAKISREILEKNRDFFADSNDNFGKFSVRIVCGEKYDFYAQSFDINPKNAIYKAIGKVLGDSNHQELQSLATQSATKTLLDAIIFLNFRIDIECLKVLLLQKCTFVVCVGLPSFSIVRFAQKLGITLIAFTQNDFLILTHQTRF